MAEVIDLYCTVTGEFAPVPPDAVRPYEEPFVPTPPTLTELLVQLNVAIVETAQSIATVMEPFFTQAAQNAPDQHGNRAARRRKRAQPERPGWMAAFPPPDPARLSKGRQ